MWTIFIGIGLGAVQLLLLKKSVEMMSQSKTNIPLGIMITLAKLALILGVLFVIARFISLEAMLWCAGGLAGTMIIVPVIKSAMTIRKYKNQQSPEGGEE